jgi:superfamily II DNA or RNA helicase
LQGIDDTAKVAAVREIFSSELRGAAERLVQTGGVSDVRVLRGGRVVTGTVAADPRTEPREVGRLPAHRVYIQTPGVGLDMQGECSCGERIPCVHLAAVWIAAATNIRALPDQPPNPREASLPRSESRTAARQQLCYVLHRRELPDDSKPGSEPQLTAWVASRAVNDERFRADGACPFTPRMSNEATEYPRYVDAQDQQILRTLGPHPESRWELRGAAGLDVLQRTIATGRIHWQSLEGPPLRHGAPRRLNFCWEVLPNGDQRLRCENVAAVEILTELEPAAYIDPHSMECGPLECGFPEQLRRYWNQAPVPPEQVAVVNEHIGRGIDAAAFPRLRALPIQKQALASLRAKLVLSAGAAATLYFVYNGCAIDSRMLSADPDTLRVVDGDTLYEIARDRHTERQLRAQLDAMPLERQQREAWLAFMQNTVPALREADWEVLVDGSFPYRIAAVEDWYAELQPNRRPQWFDLQLGVMVDGHPVNLLPALVGYLQAAGKTDASSLVGDLVSGDYLFVEHADGRYLPVALERIRRIADTLVELFDKDDFDGRQALSLPRSQASRLAELTLETPAPRLRSDDPALLRRIDDLKDFSAIEPLPASANFQATLRPYQQEGLGWLQFLRRYGQGGILADDMGLGKTVQTLAHLALEKEHGRLRGPSLIVAPVSVLGNWRQEIQRFAPHLTLVTLHGPKRREWFDRLDKVDIVITSYPLLQVDEETLSAREFYYLILDEAQTIKNPRAKVSHAVRALRAHHRLCLTGTPMENHLGDLWSLFDFLQPGLLGDEKRFQRQYRTPIERYGDKNRAQALSRRIMPFLLRRTKDAVARDLPPKTQIVESIILDEPQRDFYDGIRLAMHKRVRDAIRQQGLARSHITVLDALLKLRQACCDPRLVDKEVHAPLIASAKMEWLATSLPELVADGRRILLFSQFTSMLRLIEALVHELKIPHCLLTGTTQNRPAVIEKFQSGAAPLFLISLKAGGTGLNLTAADTVIHFDPWWNPAAEAQATDRAHRIGQDKPVFVYKLIAQRTIEEKIMQLQASKQELLSQLYSDKNALPTQLGAADVEALFEP